MRQGMTKLATYEGVVENGHVTLPPGVDIPEETRVYVLVPDANTQRTFQIMSPRLADSTQAKDFVKEVIEETPDASI
jgi:hypothetical protein